MAIYFAPTLYVLERSNETLTSIPAFLFTIFSHSYSSFSANKIKSSA